MVFGKLESKWLKRKLAENAYVFGEHLDASSRYIASKAPRVLPTSNILKPGAASSAAASAVALPTAAHRRPPLARVRVRLPWGARARSRCARHAPTRGARLLMPPRVRAGRYGPEPKRRG